MRNPLYAILVSPDWSVRDRILDGTKEITIRLGHRYYRPGPVMLCCPIDSFVVTAEITSVRHCLLHEVTEKEMKDDEFFDQAHMLDCLQSHYPQITLDSEVTVIRWANIQSPASPNTPTEEHVATRR